MGQLRIQSRRGPFSVSALGIPEMEQSRGKRKVAQGRGEEELGEDEAAHAGLPFPTPMVPGGVVLLDDALGEGRAGRCCGVALGARTLGEAGRSCRLVQAGSWQSPCAGQRQCSYVGACAGSSLRQRARSGGRVSAHAGLLALALVATTKRWQAARAWADTSFLTLGLSKGKCGFSTREDFCCCKHNMAESC